MIPLGRLCLDKTLTSQLFSGVQFAAWRLLIVTGHSNKSKNFHRMRLIPKNKRHEINRLVKNNYFASARGHRVKVVYGMRCVIFHTGNSIYWYPRGPFQSSLSLRTRLDAG